jgi:hypothetical protein
LSDAIHGGEPAGVVDGDDEEDDIEHGGHE